MGFPLGKKNAKHSQNVLIIWHYYPTCMHGDICKHFVEREGEYACYSLISKVHCGIGTYYTSN